MIRPVAVRRRHRDRRAARAVQQIDRDAGNTRLRAGILQAVAVRVEPHIVADRRQLVDARIDRVVRLARGQRDRTRQARAVRIAVQRRVAAGRLNREHVAARRNELHLVAARCQAGEVICPVAVRRRYRDRRRARPVQQVHRHAGKAGLRARVLHAVAVVIHPHIVADRRRLVDARIDRVVGLTRGQRDRTRQARAVRIAVDRRVAASRLNREHVAARRDKLHLVAARKQVREVIRPAAVRRRHRDRRRARSVQQVHRYAGNAGLAAVLQPVAVIVQPHIVADRCQATCRRLIKHLFNDANIGGSASADVNIGFNL